jgi:hypothetical protein
MPSFKTTRAARLMTLTLGLAAAASVPAVAQMQIAVGQTISGQILGNDPVFTDGSHYDLYTFFGQAGMTVQITMMSSDFDSYLILQDQFGNELDRNDDGGSGLGLNSRITRVLGYTGAYRIIAKPLSSNRFGSYTLTVAPLGGGMPVAMAPTANPMGVVGTIMANQQMSNTLSAMDARWENKPFQAYAFQCMAGQSFQMDVLSTWDNYALVFDPMNNVVARDDDTGEGLNARINHTCQMTGMYRLAVTTYRETTTPGAYTLQVASAGMAMPMAQPMPQPMAQPMMGAIPAPGAVGTIQIGQVLQGRLEPGDQQAENTWVDVWQFQGFAGQTVTIELRSSEFDTYLKLLDTAGNILSEDDDSAGDLDSRIVITLPAQGTYQLFVSNFGDSRSAGLYTLSLR